MIDLAGARIGWGHHGALSIDQTEERRGARRDLRAHHLAQLVVGDLVEEGGIMLFKRGDEAYRARELRAFVPDSREARLLGGGKQIHLGTEPLAKDLRVGRRHGLL